VIDLGTLRRAASMLDADLRRRWIGLAALSVAAAAVEAVGVLGIFWLIGIVASPQTATKLPIVGQFATKIGFDGSPHWLIGSALAVMAFYTLKNVFLIFHHYHEAKMPHDAFDRVSTALLGGYLTTGYHFHFDRNSAEIIRNLISSVDVVFRTVLHNAVTLISEVLVVIAVLGVLVAASPTRALFAVGVLVVVAGSMFRLSQRRVTKWGFRVQALGHDVLKVINQALGAIKEVKVMHREDYFLQQYRKAREQQSQVMCYYETFQNIPLLSLEALFALLIGGLIILVTLEGVDHATIIPLLGLYGYVGLRLLPALARISAKLQRVGFGAAAVDQVHADYMQLLHARRADLSEGPPMPFARELRIDDVTYAYPNSAVPALNHVSLAIPNGATIGIVGPSGGGKSTLIDIILGLLLPNSGRILVDGVDTSTAVRAWQRNLGYVPQSPYLLDDTLRRNIAFGVPDNEVDELAVADAVRMAQLSDLVASLPKGLDTAIGERGIRLSGGQRQRIVISRALYRQPSVLVFDEATSALDAQTEREIAEAIDSLAGQKTIIIIAHRMTTVRKCNAIAFMVDGHIDDIGTFDELVARNPAFSRLALAADHPRADIEESIAQSPALGGEAGTEPANVAAK
jgi:ATP-binding cassette, subfamily B, bacterial PglK